MNGASGLAGALLVRGLAAARAPRPASFCGVAALATTAAACGVLLLWVIYLLRALDHARGQPLQLPAGPALATIAWIALTIGLWRRGAGCAHQGVNAVFGVSAAGLLLLAGGALLGLPFI